VDDVVALLGVLDPPELVAHLDVVASRLARAARRSR